MSDLLKQKILYHYNPDNFVFEGTSQATPDPNNPGQYFGRINTTEIAPPDTKLKEHEVLQYDTVANVWKIVPDWRGTYYWTRNAENKIVQEPITEVGVGIPEGGYLNYADVPPTLDEAKLSTRRKLTEWFDWASANAHIMSSVGFEINADDTANRNIEGLITSLTAIGDGATADFRGYDNQFHKVNVEQLSTMRLEIIKHAQDLYAEKWGYSAQIEKATTVEELNEIEIPEIVWQ